MTRLPCKHTCAQDRVCSSLASPCTVGAACCPDTSITLGCSLQHPVLPSTASWHPRKPNHGCSWLTTPVPPAALLSCSLTARWSQQGSRCGLTLRCCRAVWHQTVLTSFSRHLSRTRSCGHQQSSCCSIPGWHAAKLGSPGGNRRSWKLHGGGCQLLWLTLRQQGGRKNSSSREQQQQASRKQQQQQ